MKGQPIASKVMNMRRENRVRFCNRLEDMGVKGAYVSDSASLSYLTGYRGPGVAEIDCADVSVTLYVPLLDYRKVVETLSKYVDRVTPVTGGIPSYVYEYVESWGAIAQDCEKRAFALVGRFDISTGCSRVDDILSELRQVKTTLELEIIEEGTKVTEDILSMAVELLFDGAFKKVGELWSFLTISAYKHGEGPSFEPIVAADDASVYPHSPLKPQTPLDRATLVLVDYGIIFHGYSTDMTRVILLREDASIREQLEFLSLSMQDAISVIREGVEGWEPDARSRARLRLRGFDKYFIHSLGHGVGVQVHETPRLSLRSRDGLRRGNVVTVEPGVYFQFYGLRLENMVVVERNGARVLNKMPLLIS